MSRKNEANMLKFMKSFIYEYAAESAFPQIQSRRLFNVLRTLLLLHERVCVCVCACVHVQNADLFLHQHFGGVIKVNLSGNVITEFMHQSMSCIIHHH